MQGTNKQEELEAMARRWVEGPEGITRFRGDGPVLGPVEYALEVWRSGQDGGEPSGPVRPLYMVKTICPHNGSNTQALTDATVSILLARSISDEGPILFGAEDPPDGLECNYCEMRAALEIIRRREGIGTADIWYAAEWWETLEARWEEVRKAAGVPDLALALWVNTDPEQGSFRLEWHWYRVQEQQAKPNLPERQWRAVHIQTVDVAGALRDASRQATDLEPTPAAALQQPSLPLDVRSPSLSAPYPQHKPGSKVTISVPTTTPAARKRLAEALQRFPDLDLREVLASYPRSVEIWLAIQHRFRRADGTVRRDASFRPSDLVELLHRPRSDGYVRVERYWHNIYEHLMYAEIVNVRVPTGLADPLHVESPLVLRAIPYRYERGEVLQVDGHDLRAVQAVEISLSQHMQRYLERGGWWHVPRELFLLRDEIGRACLLWILGHAIPRMNREEFPLSLVLQAAGVMGDYEDARDYGKGRRWIKRHIEATLKEAERLGVIVRGDIVTSRILTGRRGRPREATALRVIPVPFGDRRKTLAVPALPPAVGAPWTGARLRVARTRAGLTQAALATEVGVTQGTVARWESERLSIPLSVHPILTGIFGPPPLD